MNSNTIIITMPATTLFKVDIIKVPEEWLETGDVPKNITTLIIRLGFTAYIYFFYM